MTGQIREPSDFLDRYSRKGMNSTDGTDDEFGDLLAVEDTIEDDDADSLLLASGDVKNTRALFSSKSYQI
jgi:hypothetical protein